MEQRTDIGGKPDRHSMPAAIRWTVLGVLSLVVAGALYLMSVRGEAMLLDLSALGRIFCF